MGLNGRWANLPVAVDAMGGDNAPGEIVKGAIEACRRGVDVVLVGQKEVLRRHLDELGADLPVCDAPLNIGMDDSFTRAVLDEPSSLKIGADMVSAGEALALVSAGNSGAIMAIAYHTWGKLPGIDRPSFGGFLPSRTGGVFVLDVGANPTVKPHHLIQFAVMGQVYVKVTQDVEDPRIALLSNGAEDTKGTKEIKEANLALRKLDMNFVGNIEGNHVFDGDVDVVVCDGFAGNVLLKVGEGVAMEIFELLRAEVAKDLVARMAAAALMPALTRIKRRVDFEEYGGVPVLGVTEVMINCHGRSKAKAVTNAIIQADKLAREHLPQRISQALDADDVESGTRRRIARALHLRHERHE